MTDPDRVLVPLVGTPREAEALEYAVATFEDAAITVLGVVAPLDASLSEGGVLERDEETDRAARERASAALESAAVDRDRVTIATATGRPGNVVPQYAGESGFDHVVLQGRDAGPLARRLLGRGIATTVTERAPVPVTVVD